MMDSDYFRERARCHEALAAAARHKAAQQAHLALAEEYRRKAESPAS
jgi:hypothetical protein